ncbi:hypothetical protein ACJWDR_37800 [Streptomyces tauricus]|uniref:hypothetical protein n=1 Tax=Streptomyces tauricus TaxID=68274 RepID=UPI00387EFFA3
MFITRRRHETELAAAKAEADRMRAERDTARAERETYKRTTLRTAYLFAVADGAARRMAGRVEALRRQLRIADDAAGIDHQRAHEVGARLSTVRDAAARGREHVASGGEAS